MADYSDSQAAQGADAGAALLEQMVSAGIITQAQADAQGGDGQDVAIVDPTSGQVEDAPSAADALDNTGAYAPGNSLADTSPVVDPGTSSAPASQTSSATTTTTPNPNSGTAAVQAILQMIGMKDAKANDGSDLATWLLNDLRTNSGLDLSTASQADITGWIDLALPKQTAYQQRFPGIMEQLASGQAPTSAVDYIAWEDSAKAIASQYGLDYNAVFTPDVVAANIVGQVSPNELQSRFDTYYAGVMDAPPEVLQAYEQFYGVNGAQGLAMQIAGQEPSTLLKQQMETAQIQGAGATLGLNVNQNRATRLAQLGVSYSSTLTSLKTLSASAGLYTPTIGEASASAGAGGAPTISENDQGITAALGAAGLDDPTANATAVQNAQNEVNQRALERQNNFVGGGGGTGSANTGNEGAGSANSA